MKKFTQLTLIIISFTLISACSLGPKRIASNYSQYNEAIRKTTDEQLLLNIVRLRYQQSPVFLQIDSISSNYSTGINLGGALTQSSASENLASGSTSGNYTESPTITYSIPESEALFGKMLAPLGADQISFLSQIGTPDATFRIAVRRINGMPNVINSSSGLIKPNGYDDFIETLALTQKLIQTGQVDLSFGSIPIPVSPAIDELDAEGITSGLNPGNIEFIETPEGKYIANEVQKVAYLRFSPYSVGSKEADRLRFLLRLDPKRYNFEIMNAMDTREEKDRMRGNQLAAALDPKMQFSQISLENRSMMEVLYFASKSIAVPQEHINSGITIDGLNPMPDLLVVNSSKVKPMNAAVRVFYEGHWFYIAANERRSKWTLNILNAMLASTAGNIPGGKPILTLPVN